MVSIEEIKKYHSGMDDLKLLRHRVHRFIARYIVKILLYTPVTGNQVSFFACFLGVVIGVLFAFGEFLYSIIGLVLLFLHANLDFVDGMIARYRKSTNTRGIFMDQLMHSLAEPLIYFGLTLGVFRNTNNIWFLIFGILAAIFSIFVTSIQKLKNNVIIIKLMEYAKGKNVGELKDKKIEIMNTEEGKSEKYIFWKRFVKKLLLYLTYPYLLFVLVPAILFDFTQWVLIFYGIALPIKYLIIMIYEYQIDYKYLEYLFKPYQSKK